MAVIPLPQKTIHRKLESTVETFIESSGKISANMLGMVNRVGGQIYALLFMLRNPISLDEISEILKTSKGNVSVNIRLLEEHGLVRKVWVKGSRRDYYEARRDMPRKLLKSFFDRVRDGIDGSLRVINQCRVELEEASKEVKGDDAEDAAFMMAQLELLSLFYQGASRLFEDFYKGRKVDIDILRKVAFE